jgi:hypothetical protein
MRRLVYFALLVVLVGTSATCVNASTDCERWFAAYRTELAHTQQVKRLAAAKRRAKLYAQRKLAGYVAPKPVVKPHIPRGPRMSPHEALRRVDLACGVLPETVADQPLISEEEPAEFGSSEPLPEDEVGLLPGFDGPGTLLPEDGPTAPVFSETAPPPPPPAGGPPVFTPPFTTTGGGGSTPPPPPPPPPPVVPEPSSFVLLLTGLAGAARVVRRRS